MKEKPVFYKSNVVQGEDKVNKILAKMPYKVKTSDSIVGLSSLEWERLITIDGEKAVHIGVNCDTCGFFFERLGGANRSSIAPDVLSNQLRSGLTSLDPVFIENISSLMPVGKYIVTLQEISPTLVQLGSTDDYFANEQIKVWGIDPFWGLPQYPKVQYYRGETKEFSRDEKFFEFIVPMSPPSWLDEDQVIKYDSILSNGVKPTALALSILDIRQPADWEGDLEHTKHYCLSHYLIDGHHKVYSASSKQKPITLLSFLALNECVATPKEIDFTLSNI
ncbi:hypothetical protein LC048_00745 [Mesobacillus subterraneus]|uniref:hypothetical protein n=1 Tax=Mesobacillus subterraneus TaxID=285983 RepID=UPI00273FA5E9|nr:hypothetical protein [Mesobacillus subterraneus]WLR55581.1 hypothetical protein LC048_00745 [Mesobacillus subterraneus]